jgi:hypothetical protein
MRIDLESLGEAALEANKSIQKMEDLLGPLAAEVEKNKQEINPEQFDELKRVLNRKDELMKELRNIKL